MGKIKHKDITFVVQGAVDKINTPKCIDFIRKYFKNSKIILSTWENSDVAGLDYDVLVLNKDPGGFKYNNYYDNVNRQIVSSLNGLKHVQTHYAIKIRSDIALLSNKFIKYFDKYNKRNSEYKLYEKRILTYIFPSKKQHEDELTPFHICDWVFFGLTSDLIKMFDIPLVDKENWMFKNAVFPQNAPARFWKNPQKYFPEQYICYKPLEKLFSIGFEHRFCNDEKIIKTSNQFIANNYVILSHFQMPLYFLKKNRSEYCNLDFTYFQNSINFFDWLELYKKYCDSDFKFPILKRKIYLKINRIIYKNKRFKQIIEKHCKRRYE